MASANKTPASQHALLASLVGIVTKHANEQLTGLCNRLVSSLLDVDSPHLNAREVFQRVKSGNLLKENSYAFIHLAAATLEKNLREETDALLPRARSVLIADAALTLVPLEEMDYKVAFEAVSRPFELAYAPQIATLNVRLGFLLNREILRISQNPFRPEVLLSVINQAWHEFEPNAEAHALVVPLLKPALLWDLAPMYDALCETLINKGAQPGSVDAYNIKKTESATAAKAKRARHQADLAGQLRRFLGDGDDMDASFDAAIPLIPDVPPGASGSGWRPSGASGFGQHSMAPQPPAQALARHGAGLGRAHLAPGAMFDAVPGPPGSASSGQSGPEVGAGDQGTSAQRALGLFGNASHGGAAIESGMRALHAAPAQSASGATRVPLIDMLRTLQAQLPEPFMATPSHPGRAPAGDVFYLPRLKQSIPQGSLSRADESTIDLLSKVFDTVFLDPHLPPEMRELIQFLQIPVLKAALLDKNFFFEEEHPARRMINLLSRMGLDQRSVDDPVFQAMQRSVDQVGSEQAGDKQSFHAAVAELEATIKAEEKREVTAIAAPIAAALKQEKVTVATRSAKTAVAARVGSGEVVAVLETFLENKWTSVLTVAYSVEPDKPGAVSNATRTMDELIWSVKPKISHTERRALIVKLPGLLATLNKWLDIIQWQDADRLRFFAELAECHASIVRAPLDISAERQLEIAVEVAQGDAQRRLDKENASAQAVEQEVDDATVLIESLERGAWMDFTQSDASVRKAKLAWVSPLRTLFIFSLGARRESFSLAAEKLVAGLRGGTVRLVHVDGVVERALSAAMGAGAVNDNAIERRAGAAA